MVEYFFVKKEIECPFVFRLFRVGGTSTIYIGIAS
jgi:hypothetical protein